MNSEPGGFALFKNRDSRTAVSNQQLQRDKRSCDTAIRCMDDPNRSVWAEVEKIRHCNTGNSIIVDDCTNESAIAQLFASKYPNLYNSVSFDKDEMQHILNELDGKILFVCLRGV